MVVVKETVVEKCRSVIETLLKSPDKSWVLFKNQTFVILRNNPTSKEMATEKATELMKVYGPVYAGCPAGDFGVLEDNEGKGWIVTGHCEDMFTYVCKEQGSGFVGLIGRGMRDQDGRNPEVVHVELVQ